MAWFDIALIFDESVACRACRICAGHIPQLNLDDKVRYGQALGRNSLFLAVGH